MKRLCDFFQPLLVDAGLLSFVVVQLRVWKLSVELLTPQQTFLCVRHYPILVPLSGRLPVLLAPSILPIDILGVVG